MPCLTTRRLSLPTGREDTQGRRSLFPCSPGSGLRQNPPWRSALTHCPVTSTIFLQVRPVSGQLLNFMQSGWGTSPATPRQPGRDHISRLVGANSLPETGNMRFGHAAVSPAFSYPLFLSGEEAFLF